MIIFQILYMLTPITLIAGGLVVVTYGLERRIKAVISATLITLFLLLCGIGSYYIYNNHVSALNLQELNSSEHNYVFAQAVGHQSQTTYLYICKDCHKLYETTKYYPLAEEH